MTTQPTITTTSTIPSWTAPTRESLVHEGKIIDEDDYQILMQTATMFGIERYTIMWSDHPVEYGYANPGEYFCMREGFAYGLGVQIVPSSDIFEITNMKKLKGAEYKSNYTYIAYRPLNEADNMSNVLDAFEVTETGYKDTERGVIIAGINDIVEPANANKGEEGYLLELDAENWMNTFKFIGWYLVPTDEDGNQILELNNSEPVEVAVAAETKYWFTNNELTSGGAPVSRNQFNAFINEAEILKMSNFVIKYNEDKYTPTMYSFVNSGITTAFTTVQVIPTADIVKVIDLNARALEEANGNPDLAKIYYNDWLDENQYPFYYWDPIEKEIYFYSSLDSFDRYCITFLDSEGNEILNPIMS